MGGTRDVQTPVPGGAHGQGLRVERVIPAATDNLNPALDVAGQVERPGAPGPLVLGRHVLVGHGVPAEAAVGGQLDALGPAAAAAVGPALALDGAVVDDDLLGPRRHDGRRHGHLLDLDPVRRLLVVLAHLLVEVQVLLALHGRQAGPLDRFDAVQPLDAARPNVPQHNHPQREPVDRRQRFAVHLPRQEHLVRLDFGPRHADQVVHRLVVFEVRLGPVELEVLGPIDQPAARLDHLLQADSRVFRRADRPFRPRRLWHFVALSCVQRDLLDAARARTLHGDELLDPRVFRLVHQVVEVERLGVRDQPVQRHAPLLLVDQRDPAVVAHKVQRVGRDGFVRHEPLRWLAVVWEL